MQQVAVPSKILRFLLQQASTAHPASIVIPRAKMSRILASLGLTTTIPTARHYLCPPCMFRRIFFLCGRSRVKRAHECQVRDPLLIGRKSGFTLSVALSRSLWLPRSVFGRTSTTIPSWSRGPGRLLVPRQPQARTRHDDAQPLGPLRRSDPTSTSAHPMREAENQRPCALETIRCIQTRAALDLCSANHCHAYRVPRHANIETRCSCSPHGRHSSQSRTAALIASFTIRRRASQSNPCD
ncbi:hypothetical protein B0H11DRAFT_2110247 [Mycena galericulata]|nr:hypothetical protein B0H11DRAFT_2110247 [Mycena galericulata]